MAKTVLSVKNVTKMFGRRKAVNNVSLEIQEGEIFGLIGPNGAGKTTLLRSICGLTSINDGSVIINDFNIATDFEKAIVRVGGIIEEPKMYSYLSGYDNLKFFASLYGKVDKERIEKLCKIAKMQNRIKDKVKTYSLGMRQRLGIVQALVHKPNLLILDEPLNGLDPTGIVELRNFLKDIAKSEKIAILISSHNLLEVELLCEYVTIIKEGKIIANNKIEDLEKDILDSQRYCIKVSHPNFAGKLILTNFITDDLKIAGNSVFIKTSEKVLQKIFKALIDKGISILGTSVTSKTLEEIYLEQIGKSSSNEGII